MIQLEPTYLTEEHVSLALLEDKKDELREKGVDFVQTDDFSFYLEKSGVKIEGTLGYYFGDVELYIEKPAFIGPIVEVIKEMFQVEYALEHQNESQ